MNNEWFAIRTKSNRESAVSQALAGKGYEVLFPRYSVVPHLLARSKPMREPSQPVATRPLFPGYLFCRFDPSMRMPILTVPGVMNVVSNGRIPIPLDEREIESVRVLVESQLPLLPHDYLKPGDTVRILDGPLAGAEGNIVRSSGSRLVVSITLLQRAVSVEVAPEWLETRRYAVGMAC